MDVALSAVTECYGYIVFIIIHNKRM